MPILENHPITSPWLQPGASRGLLVITDTAPTEEVLIRLQQVLAAGVRLVQLRLPGLDDRHYSAVATPAMAMSRQVGACLLLNCSATLANRLGADGIHLSARRLAESTERPLSRLGCVAASCHNVHELVLAQRMGVDFAVLSPVLSTTSHPGAPTLGWARFGALVANAGIPLYALGGMTPDQVPLAQAHGAQGVAVLSAVWHATDIGQAIRAYTAEQGV